MKHTQFGWVMVLVIGLLPGLILLAVYMNTGDVPLNPIPNGFGVTLAILVLVLLTFYQLTIEVNDEKVKVIFGIGWLRFSYKLENVKTCRSKTYMPLGWGIRFRPGVILFNVSGNKAVELEFKDSWRKVWIGTNKPEEIAEFINSKLNK